MKSKRRRSAKRHAYIGDITSVDTQCDSELLANSQNEEEEIEVGQTYVTAHDSTAMPPMDMQENKENFPGNHHQCKKKSNLLIK